MTKNRKTTILALAGGVLALSCAHSGGEASSEANVTVDPSRPGAPPGEYCPAREPSVDSACPTRGEKCTYLSGDHLLGNSPLLSIDAPA